MTDQPEVASTRDSNSLPVFESWSPYMALAEYDGEHWSQVEIKPHAPLNLAPGAMALQFGSSVFEGLKARRNAQGKGFMFRRDENYRRLHLSAERLCLPCPSQALFNQALEGLVGNTVNWTSPFASEWLYLRPVLYAMDDHLMPVVSQRVLFMVLAAPIRSFKPASLSLRVERLQHRAAPGGLGAAKTAANYAHQFQATHRAQRAGDQAVLWLSAKDGSTIEEASTMNVFFVFDTKVVTPRLSDSVLAGITRDTAIVLLQKSGITVEERDITIDEVVVAVQAQQLGEMFVTSTALGVRTVDRLQFNGDSLPTSRDAKVSCELAKAISAIQAGGTDSQTACWLTRVTLYEEG
jgi:branched-chain amino acid aminotransferase